jgi:hypothetical protein
LLILLIVVLGCGGGGGSSALSTTGGGSSSGGGAITPTQRQAIMSSIANSVMALPSSSDGALHNQSAIVSILKASSKITGIVAQTNGNVSGRFSDGVPFCVVNNVPSDGNPNLPPNPIYTDESSSAQLRSIPATGNVVMLNGFGDSFAMPGATDVSMFQSNGYTVSNGRATVAALKNLGTMGTAMGVLFFSGHGGDTNPLPDINSGSSGFGLWTATKYDPNAWQTYQADVQVNKSLAFMLAANNYIRSASGDVIIKNGIRQVGQEWHYAILPPFVKEYKWNLASDSLVMLNSCSAGSGEAGLFQSALQSAHASMIAAWTQVESVDKGFLSASYLFDRMLGANTVEPPVTPGNPPRRSFSFAESKKASDLKHLTNYPLTVNYPGINGGKPYSYIYNPVLIPILPSGTTSESDQFTILKPALLSESISYSANGTGPQFMGYGYFGIPGKANTTLTVGSSTLTPSTVTNFSLTAPASSSLFGMVTVHVKRGDGKLLNSNTRNLSSWAGKVTTTTNSFGQTEGDTVAMGTFDAHFLADLQSRYDTPDQLTPTPYSPPETISGHTVYPISESAGDTLTVSGSGTSETITRDSQGNVVYSDTITLGGNDSIKLFGNTFAFSHVTLSLPPDTGKPAYMSLSEDTTDVLSYSEQIFENGSTSNNNTKVNVAFESSYFTGDMGDLWIPITIDKMYNISALPTEQNGAGGPGSGGQEIMVFPAMPCKSPPVGNTAR